MRVHVCVGVGGDEEIKLTSTHPNLAMRLVLDRITALVAALCKLRPFDDNDRILLHPRTGPFEQKHLGCPEADTTHLQEHR